MSDEIYLKKMEFLQNIISRMANNSASCKNYAITFSSGLLAFFATVYSSQKYCITFTIPILLIFSILDAYYLKEERAFKNSYNIISLSSINNNNLEIKAIYTGNATFLKSYFSCSILGFYMLIITFISIFFILF